ncbi:MAG: copper chaperone PCu(A)C [Rickettsiales bacterium]
MSNKLRMCTVLLLALLVSNAAVARVTITQAWSPVRPTSTGVAYFTAVSDRDDAIISASSDCCAAVELHEHTMDGDVMRMRQVEAVELPAGKPVTFAPHGLHVMLIGMKTTPAIGDTIPVTLTFKHAAAQQIRITVRK